MFTQKKTCSGQYSQPAEGYASGIFSDLYHTSELLCQSLLHGQQYSSSGSGCGTCCRPSSCAPQGLSLGKWEMLRLGHWGGLSKTPPKEHCSTSIAWAKSLCSLRHTAVSIVSGAFNRPKVVRDTLYVLPRDSLDRCCTPEVTTEQAAAALCKATDTKGENGELTGCLCCPSASLCRGPRSQRMLRTWCSIRSWGGGSQNKGG